MMFVSFNINTTGVTCEAGTANASGAPEFTYTHAMSYYNIGSPICNIHNILTYGSEPSKTHHSILYALVTDNILL
jgi:hypothetical protein